MDILQTILTCKDEELDSVIEKLINERNEKADKVELLGFTSLFSANSIFHGFIPLDTKIKYENTAVEIYSMQTTDFIYEYARYVRSHNIKNIYAFVYNLAPFMNNEYFGMPGINDRHDIFDTRAWQNSTTDKEYFAALNNNKIGDLKGMGAALCTERAAVAQQILSVFGVDTYYCIGCIERNNQSIPHAFNLIKIGDDYSLLDCSMMVGRYNEDRTQVEYYPFVVSLTQEKFNNLINNGSINACSEYYWVDKAKYRTGSERSYAVGSYEIKRESSIGSK